MSRLLFLRAVVLIVVAVLIGRLYQLQLGHNQARDYNNALGVSTTRWKTIAPIRGEVLAIGGDTQLVPGMPLPPERTVRLAESVRIFTVAAYPADLPPAGSYERARVFAQLNELLGVSSTLTISPSMALNERLGLRTALETALGATALAAADGAPADGLFSITLAPTQGLPLAAITFAYSDVLQLRSDADERVALADNGQRPNWQTIKLREDISREMALVLWENSATLPGIVVEQDYKRRYPQSGTIPSLSHILGYIGRIGECELVVSNPAPTWSETLLESMGHAVNCGLRKKQFDPRATAPRYLDDDRIGKDGLEYLHEAELRGQVGLQSLLVDVLDRQIGPAQSVGTASTGNNMVVTLDLAFQQQVENLLRKWLAEAERRRTNPPAQFAFRRNYEPITNGVALALDPRSGRLLASVSLPTYDNNIWVDPSRNPELQAVISPPADTVTETLRLAALNDRTLTGQYPPGSTLKQFVGAVALQEGVVSPDSRLHDPGSLVIRDKYVAERLFTYPNSVPGDRGNVTIAEALRYSSNVFFMSIAGGNSDQVVNLAPEDQRVDGLNIKRLAPGLRAFGFGEPTGLAPGIEATGRVPTPGWKQQVLREVWSTGDTYNMAIGQGNMLVTPLQLGAAASAIANGGTLYKPYIVQATTSPTGTVQQVTQPEAVRQVPIDSANLAVIREGMRRSVIEGANVAARDECSGLSIAGKTGTAEYSQLIPETGQQRSHAWFVGFAPYDDPQIVVVVLIEGAGDLDDGSTTLAVPAVTEIMQAYFKTAPPASSPANCPTLP